MPLEVSGEASLKGLHNVPSTHLLLSYFSIREKGLGTRKGGEIIDVGCTWSLLTGSFSGLESPSTAPGVYVDIPTESVCGHPGI